ncbi:MAG: hypothetical protein V8R01_02590 [Bacilli bacterium]
MSKKGNTVRFTYINDEKITNNDLKNAAVQEKSEPRGPVVLKHASEVIADLRETTGDKMVADLAATGIQLIITEGRTKR